MNNKKIHNNKISNKQVVNKKEVKNEIVKVEAVKPEVKIDKVLLEHNLKGEFKQEQIPLIIKKLSDRAKSQKSERHTKWLLNKAAKVELEASQQEGKEWIKLSPINVSGFYSIHRAPVAQQLTISA